MSGRPEPSRAWTVMVYMCGDNNLESSGAADIREMKRVGSSDDVAVVVQFDRYHTGEPTRRYYVRQGTRLRDDAVGAPLGETNTGDVHTLTSFIGWAVSEYPARRYMLVLWNHGEGWDDTNVYDPPPAEAASGSPGLRPSLHRRRAKTAVFSTTARIIGRSYAIGLDDHAHDFLDNIEVKQAAAFAHKTIGRPLDILGMDACLMSMIEVVYQLRSNVRVAIASEETIPLAGWPYSRILNELAHDASMDAPRLARTIVDEYARSYPKTDRVTLAASDVDSSAAVGKAIDAWAHDLSSIIATPKGYATIASASKAAWRSLDTPAYVDIASFCTALAAAVPRSSPVRRSAGALAERVTHDMVLRSASRGRSHPTGLTIWLPETPPPAATFKLYKRLDLIKRTAWGRFLTQYWAGLSTQA